MGKKLIAIFTLLISLMEMPSCSFTGLSAQNLMSPPKANADQQSIYRLLQGSGTDVTFIYPKNGEYRSAIIMRDFTGDGVEDAIGFQTMEDGSAQVQFLMKDQAGWHTAAAFRNTSTQVDRVCFGSLAEGDAEGQAVFIGWGSAAGATGRLAAVNAYLYDAETGGITEYALGGYGEMAVTDFDGDGINELFTIDKSVPAGEDASEPTGAVARVYAFDRPEPYEAASTAADNAISNYTAVMFGDLNGTAKGVVVDGATANGSMTTQIFVMEQGGLINYPAGVNTENYQNEYARPFGTAFYPRDINGDGYIELPTVKELPGISADMSLDPTSFLVEWRAFTEGGGSRLVLRALMNPKENYWFRLPYQLKDSISAINDTERRTVTYIRVTMDEAGNQFLGSTLFTIRVFTRSAWDSRGESGGYELLDIENDSVYCMQSYAHSEQDMAYVSQIREDFQLLS